jgi:hypothetical protein
VLNDQGRPSQEELDVSDAMLFSLCDTYRLELLGDGTSMLVPNDQDDEEDGEEYDEEAEYDMWRGLSPGEDHDVETFFDQVGYASHTDFSHESHGWQQHRGVSCQGHSLAEMGGFEDD